MNKPVPYTHNPFDGLINKLAEHIRPATGGFWIKVGLIALILYIMLHKDISIVLEFNKLNATPSASPGTSSPSSSMEGVKAVHTAHKKAGKGPISPDQHMDDNSPNTFANMPFEEGQSGKDKAEKRRKMKLYVKHYAVYAKSEMKRHGIPASITLAQGLLESDAGESRLALENNNHFGIKCFSKSCKRGHCTNYTDDSHKDFFRKFNDPGESFKAHSELLQKERYQFLYEYRKTDYVSWARGLKKAGYATDPAYDQKLINLIKELGLHSYDR